MRTLRAFIVQQLGPILAGAAGGLWFLTSGAGGMVNPFVVDRLLVDDWSTHTLGWLFFRNEGLHWPLGRIEGLLYPVGTTVGYTDSIPWLTLLFRPLSFLLPVDFQFIGPFLFGSFVLAGAAGAWVVRAVSPRAIDQALGGTLIALLPALLFRVGHPSLCAQGLLLLPIGILLRRAETAAQARKMTLAALALCALAAGLHPYLAVMLVATCSVIPAKLAVVDRQLSKKVAAGVTVAMPVTVLLLFTALGYFIGGTERQLGTFGDYSADLMTFINPMNYSRWISAKPQGGYQYEGFAYLGVGLLAAMALAVVSLAVRHREARALPWRRVVWLVPLLIATTVFALGPTWTVFGAGKVGLQGFYARLSPELIGPFRSSGRFIWPLMFTVAAFAVVTIVRLWRPFAWLPAAVLAACIALQLGDVTRAPVGDRLKRGELVRYKDAAWSQLDAHYRHLSMIPPEIFSFCGNRGFRHPTIIALSYHAYVHHLTFNSGYVARAGKAQMTACTQEESAVMRGQLDPDTVYVLWPDLVPPLVQAGASCATVDGLPLCVKPSTDDAFARALRAVATR